MPVEVPFGASNERVGVPVVQTAGTDSDILSDTDRSRFVWESGQDSAESSDFDSVQDHNATGDQEMSYSAWDENIVNRRTRTGFHQ